MTTNDIKNAKDRPGDDTKGELTGDRESGESNPEKAPERREIGGRKGPDPTRYGDWEKAGRCIDF